MVIIPFNMNMRLDLKPEHERLAKSVANAQDTSKRDAVLNVFLRHGKSYTKDKVDGFSKTKWGRPKKASSPKPSK